MAFVLVNNIDLAERPHYVASHLGLHYLPKTLVYKGLNAMSLKSKHYFESIYYSELFLPALAQTFLFTVSAVHWEDAAYHRSFLITSSFSVRDIPC